MHISAPQVIRKKGLSHKTMLTLCSGTKESPAVLQGHDDNHEREILPSELPQSTKAPPFYVTTIKHFLPRVLFRLFCIKSPFWRFISAQPD